ncbi:MAG TPA: DUF4142 domain-containing protein [Methylovirgula sp.]|nr:DUF4142 domain-containing protein [Methylovirgula sp.]
MQKTTVALFAMSLASGTAFAQAAPPTSEFVQKAEIGGQLEVQAGHIAATKGTSAGVKNFGEKMVRDHTRLNEKFKSVLAKDKQDLPKETPLDTEAQDSLNKLNSASANDFDKLYVDMMVDDHKKDIADFESYAKGGDDKLIRAAARQALPTLKEHLMMAEKLQRRENRSSALSTGSMR